MPSSWCQQTSFTIYYAICSIKGYYFLDLNQRIPTLLS